MSTRWRLYEHRRDESVLIVARILDAGGYECRRYGVSEAAGTFVLDAETFLSIYRLRSRNV